MSHWYLLLFALFVTMAHAEPAKRVPPSSTPVAAGYSGLGAGSLSPQEITKYAPPPLDERMSRAIQAILDVRGTGVGLITSKGDRQIYSSRITGIAQVWRQDGPMKYPVELTGGEDLTLAVAIAPDDSFVVVSRDFEGQQNPGLYLLSLDGGPLRFVQHIPMVQTELQYISDDSKSLYIRANDKDPTSYVIYRYDIANNARELVFEEKGLWSIIDHRGDSTWLLIKSLGSTQQEIYEYDLKTKGLTPLLGQGESEEYDVAYGAKPGQVLVRTNKLGNFQRLYLLAAGNLTPITPDNKHDVDAFRIDGARRRIYYETNEDGYRRLAALDGNTFSPVALPKFPSADNVSLAAVSRNGRFAEIVLEGATLVPQARILDWQTGKLTAWRVPNTPEIDPRSFAKGALESYPARDGTRIPMLVWRPARCEGPCPVIVDFHGGPEDQSRPGFSRYAQLYVDAGFTYVTPNVRGSSGYGKAWLHADDGPRRLTVISDIEDAAKFIRANWGKDGRPPKIGVSGASYGGYAALMAMAYFAGAYDAGVEEVGMSNLTTFLMNTSPYRRILRISEYGDPVKDREVLARLSPITYIDKVKAPLLLIQGVNDPRVPVGESLQIYRQLEQRNIPCRLILFADEGHGANKRSNIVLSIGHSIAFFEKYLLGK